MKKIFLAILILLSPLALAAETTVSSDADGMVTQMKAILDQYAVRIKTLEVENNKIPLSVYSGAILQVPTATTPTKTGTTTTAIVTPPVSNTVNTGAITDTLSTQFGARYAGYITKIRSDWTGIQ